MRSDTFLKQNGFRPRAMAELKEPKWSVVSDRSRQLGIPETTPPIRSTQNLPAGGAGPPKYLTIENKDSFGAGGIGKPIIRQQPVVDSTLFAKSSLE